MGRRRKRPEADVIIGAIKWQGAPEADTPPATGAAEVIRFAPYLLARRGRAVAPPGHRA
jgi:hypothetical protein